MKSHSLHFDFLVAFVSLITIKAILASESSSNGGSIYFSKRRHDSDSNRNEHIDDEEVESRRNSLSELHDDDDEEILAGSRRHGDPVSPLLNDADSLRGLLNVGCSVSRRMHSDPDQSDEDAERQRLFNTQCTKFKRRNSISLVKEAADLRRVLNAACSVSRRAMYASGNKEKRRVFNATCAKFGRRKGVSVADEVVALRRNTYNGCQMVLNQVKNRSGAAPAETRTMKQVTGNCTALRRRQAEARRSGEVKELRRLLNTSCAVVRRMQLDDEESDEDSAKLRLFNTNCTKFGNRYRRRQHV